MGQLSVGGSTGCGVGIAPCQSEACLQLIAASRLSAAARGVHVRDTTISWRGRQRTWNGGEQKGKAYWRLCVNQMAFANPPTTDDAGGHQMDGWCLSAKGNGNFPRPSKVTCDFYLIPWKRDNFRFPQVIDWHTCDRERKERFEYRINDNAKRRRRTGIDRAKHNHLPYVGIRVWWCGSKRDQQQ